LTERQQEQLRDRGVIFAKFIENALSRPGPADHAGALESLEVARGA
jgi:hypothetical protein